MGICRTKSEVEMRASLYTIDKIKIPWLIKFIARYGFIWEIILYVATILSYCFITYAAFFSFYDEKVWLIIYYCDLIFLADVLLRLILEEWRYLNRIDVVILRVPYRFSYCILDVISIAPIQDLYFLLNKTNTLSQLSTMGFFMFNRFIRLYRAYIFFDVLGTEYLSEQVVFVLRFTNFYLAFIHMVSCCLFWMTNLEPLDFQLRRNLSNINATWMRDFMVKKKDFGDSEWDLYVLSTNFATAVVTTVGYGDLFAVSENEMLYCIIIMLIGAIFLSGYFTSRLTNFLLEFDGARFDLFFRLHGIKLTLGEMTNPFLISKAEQYYKYLWTYKEGVSLVTLKSQLPLSFHEDIYFDICQEMFHKSFLFNNLDEAFLRAVSKIVHVALYNPDMILCRYGGYANQMYYILQGECRVISKFDSSKTAAILRAGSIIGETNIFFSSAYTLSVETRTCCQFIILRKEDLMNVIDKFPNELFILRARSQEKLSFLYKVYEKHGIDPICWVQKKENAKAFMNEKTENLGVSLRWGDGINRKVKEDVINDTERTVIFDHPCSDKSAKINHIAPYETCVVPEIMVSELTWIRWWNIFMIVSSLTYSFMYPYCIAFAQSSTIEMYMCSIFYAFTYVNIIVYIFDVFVEIIGAVPVQGLYYRFWDGLKMKKHEFLFWLDVLAALPMEMLYTSDQKNIILLAYTAIKSLKIWKVIRYLRFLDNVHPTKIFWFRLGQTILVLLYGIHYIACILFIVACPERNGNLICESNSWLASYEQWARLNDEKVDEKIRVHWLAHNSPYLLSFHFASATLTSAGFGDFNPQNIVEMLWCIFFQLIGVFIIGYYTSVLSSALSCIIQPRLEFQQKLVSIRYFMQYNFFQENLQLRVIDHYRLQNQLRYGINLPPGVNHFLYDAPEYLQADALYKELVLYLDGVPIFSKCNANLVIKLADKMKRFLIPPDVMFVHIGEVRRCMYILRKGSIGVYTDKDSTDPHSILSSSTHFGIQDLLFGLPCHYNLKTLSYCYIYEIEYEQFMEIFQEDEDLMEAIEAHRISLKDEVEMIRRHYAKIKRNYKNEDKPITVPSYLNYDFPSNSTSPSTLQCREYLRLYNFRGSSIVRMLLMPISFHPVGFFCHFWCSIMGFASAFSFANLFIETFMLLRAPWFRALQWLSDVFFYVDIYVKLHWGYYIPGPAILVSHSIKTATMYIFYGSFFQDIFTATPLELILYMVGATSFSGYGLAAPWYTKLRWVRFFQVKRITIIFEIAHNIFKHRNLVLFILYVSVTFLVCTILASIAIFIGCPWDGSYWREGDEYRLPLCLNDTWTTTKFDASVLVYFTQRWTAGVYYVSQVILVIGFGDMTSLAYSEVLLLIFMSVLGFIFMRCVIADLTSAEVDSDDHRLRYRERIITLKLIMTRERLPPKMITNVMEHLTNTWEKSKALQPKDIFGDLHSSLKSDLFKHFVGKEIHKVELFKGLRSNTLRTLCQYVSKTYFVKGEILARFGNLEPEMFIIISGKVWITDDQLNYGCTLRKSDAFGESNLLRGSARNYTAIAASSVEVLTIAGKDFNSLLDKYPHVKEIIASKTAKGAHDQFELKVWKRFERIYKLKNKNEKMSLVKALRARTEKVKRVLANKESSSPNEVNYSKKGSQLHKIIKKIVGFGHKDHYLPFLYFAKRNKKSSLNRFPFILIHPNCALSNLYMRLIRTLRFITPALSVYELCFCKTYFDEKQKFEDNRNVLAAKENADMYVAYIIHSIADYFEYIMITHIVVKFLTPFEEQNGLYCKNIRSIAIRYVGQPTEFALDLIAILPELVFPKNSTWNLLRLLRLYPYYQSQESPKNDLTISTFRHKILISLTSFCLMAHMLSCVFYVISECDYVEVPSYNPCKNPDRVTWTFVFAEQDEIWRQPKKMVSWRWYIRSLYWVVTVISTTGFGDITPQNIMEMGVGIITIFSGAFILSIILSQFITGMASLTRTNRAYFYQVKLLLKYFRNIGLSAQRQRQVLTHFQMNWDTCHGVPYHDSLTILPISMQIDVAYALYSSVLLSVKLFSVTNKPTFLRQTAKCLKHSMYLPGIHIVKEGDHGSSLYIVYKGQVSGTQLTANNGIQLKKLYQPGDTFGKLPALFHDEYYKKSYRAEKMTEILEMSQNDLMYLAVMYPEFAKILKSYVDATYDSHGPSDCVFSPKRPKAKDLFDLGEDYSRKNSRKKTK